MIARTDGLKLLLVISELVIFAAWSAGFATASSSSGDVSRRPLDLPAGYRGDGEEDEEDEPEVITFYGAQIEGDAFFWCLDRSCSMGGQDLETLKLEATAAVRSLSSRSEFSLVAFNNTYVVWSETPRRAALTAKEQATAWIQSLVADGNTCIAPPSVKTLDIAGLSLKRRPRMLLLGDGEPVCGGETMSSVLADITTANFRRIPIDTFYISSGDDTGRPLYQAIASANGGSFRIVD